MSEVPNAPPGIAADASVRHLIVRLFKDDAGQDIIEYGLLAAFIATVGILTWQAILAQVGTHYAGWDSSIQTRSMNVPDPGAGGS